MDSATNSSNMWYVTTDPVQTGEGYTYTIRSGGGLINQIENSATQTQYTTLTMDSLSAYVREALYGKTDLEFEKEITEQPKEEGFNFLKNLTIRKNETR